MNEAAVWMEMNDKHLAATVAWIRLRLQQLIPQAEDHTETDTKDSGWFKPAKKARTKSTKTDIDAIEPAYQEIVKLENNDPSPALILLAKALGLSKFDLHVLALCAAMELDTRIGGLCAKAQDNLHKPYPTFALAFALFNDPDLECVGAQCTATLLAACWKSISPMPRL